MSAWSRIQPPIEGGGSGCFAARRASKLQRCARPWPPVPPPGPQRALPGGPGVWPGSAPGQGPSGPMGRAALARAPPPRSGALRGRFGLSAGRLRPSARGGVSPGGPRCGVGWAGCWAGQPRPTSRPPARVSCGPPCAPLRARCGGARPWAAPCGPAPLPRRAGSPSRRPLRGLDKLEHLCYHNGAGSFRSLPAAAWLSFGHGRGRALFLPTPLPSPLPWGGEKRRGVGCCAPPLAATGGDEKRRCGLLSAPPWRILGSRSVLHKTAVYFVEFIVKIQNHPLLGAQRKKDIPGRCNARCPGYGYKIQNPYCTPVRARMTVYVC